VPADFLANDFAAIARAMQRERVPAPKVLLHFWELLTPLTSEHESVEDAVLEAYAFVVSRTAIPHRITATDGTVLMDGKALTRAIARYREGLPI
jgi:hypothetical protein